MQKVHTARNSGIPPVILAVIAKARPRMMAAAQEADSFRQQERAQRQALAAQQLKREQVAKRKLAKLRSDVTKGLDALAKLAATPALRELLSLKMTATFMGLDQGLILWRTPIDRSADRLSWSTKSGMVNLYADRLEVRFFARTPEIYPFGDGVAQKKFVREFIKEEVRGCRNEEFHRNKPIIDLLCRCADENELRMLIEKALDE